jgi:hypothetical protein
MITVIRESKVLILKDSKNMEDFTISQSVTMELEIMIAISILMLPTHRKSMSST